MKPAQRLGLVALAVVVVVAAFVVLQPSDDSDDDAGGGAAAPTATTPAAETTTPAPAPSTTEAPATQAAPAPPLLTAGRVRELRVDHGDVVRFRVRSSTDDEVHVHGYDIKRDVPAGETVSMQFRANLEGVFEIELEQSATQIASLRVDP